VEQTADLGVGSGTTSAEVAEVAAPVDASSSSTPSQRNLAEPGAPATLPTLLHDAIFVDLDYTGAGIADVEGATFAVLPRLSTEVPVFRRTWYAGGAWDLASAVAENEGRAVVYGNPELWFRGVGAHESGLAAGGGGAIVVPLPRDDDLRGRGVVERIRVLRPWETGLFSSDQLTIRPFFDLRYVVAPFNFQVRQGLDWSYDFELDEGSLVARLGTYAGVDLGPAITASVELWQTYSLTADVRDDARAAFTFSPAILFRAGPIEPGVSLLLPMSTPLEGIARGYFAVRLHVRLALGEKQNVELQP
jgi:hypothetical protein